MIKRGEIYWINPPVTIGSEQAGRRPFLIIQNDVGNSTSATTIVAAVTSQTSRRWYPFHVSFTSQESGLRRDGIVKCEQIQTVDQSRLGRFLGRLSAEKMREIDMALHHSLGLEH